MSEAKFLKLWGDTVSSVAAFATDESARTEAAFLQFEGGLLNGIFKLPPATAKTWQKLVLRLQVCEFAQWLRERVLHPLPMWLFTAVISSLLSRSTAIVCTAHLRALAILTHRHNCSDKHFAAHLQANRHLPWYGFLSNSMLLLKSDAQYGCVLRLCMHLAGSHAPWQSNLPAPGLTLGTRSLCLHAVHVCAASGSNRSRHTVQGP